MIIITVFKHGLSLEASVNKLARQIQNTEGRGYKSAFAEATKRVDSLAYTQVVQANLPAKDLQKFGEHITGGAPFTITSH